MAIHVLDVRHPGPATGTPAEPAPSGGNEAVRTYAYGGATFASEREMLVRFLDDFRAAERFGAVVLELWARVASDPVVRGGLRTICAREQSHAELLERRLRELGGECRAELDQDLQEAARARLASPTIADVDKLGEMIGRHADIESTVRPIRNVLAQIDHDRETRALVGTILDDEIATLRWLKATHRSLTG
jgi:hypothetical protein